jgi:hypothetical protein
MRHFDMYAVLRAVPVSNEALPEPGVTVQTGIFLQIPPAC